MARCADALAGDAAKTLICVKDTGRRTVQRRSMIRLALLIALATALPAAAAEPHAAQNHGRQGGEARGRLLVERNCGMCHAVGRAGPSPLHLAPPFRELNQRYKLNDLDEALAEGIMTGHPAMPEFRFSPAEINDIIRYLKAIQTRQAA
jgi:mono/diheme cytochrome c family protein